MNNFLYHLFGVIGVIVLIAMVLMYIPLPVIFFICVIGAGIAGWMKGGRNIDRDDDQNY